MATLEALLHDLDEAIRPASCCDAAVCKTCEVLRAFADNGCCKLPERIQQEGEGRYARHLIHHEDGDGYCVVAMVWAPGQGTPVHDHGGVWCVEGCVRGKLEITSYRMLEETDEVVHMVRENSVEVSPGKVGCLIPPFEHHKIHNPFNETAITLHVYGKELRNCTRFMEVGPDTFRRECSALCYSSLPS